VVILVNGAFGVGKTTVARHLRRALRGSVVYDPEVVGWFIRRRPPWIHLRGEGSDDYQDIALWRRSTVLGVTLVRSLSRGPVIVPMAFGRLEYLQEVTGGIAARGRDVRVFCLRARMPTIVARLRRRGTLGTAAGDGWIVRKARQCVEAHEHPAFGEPIDADTASAPEVARTILRKLGVAFRPLT
jgi:hypothetical protein